MIESRQYGAEFLLLTFLLSGMYNNLLCCPSFVESEPKARNGTPMVQASFGGPNSLVRWVLALLLVLALSLARR